MDLHGLYSDNFTIHGFMDSVQHFPMLLQYNGGSSPKGGDKLLVHTVRGQEVNFNTARRVLVS
jgi:hypothetical protein